MKLEIFLFLFWLTLIFAYNAENVDTQDVIVLKNTGEQGNQFGHSVALTKDHVYVGAPKDSTHGNVFDCPFDPEGEKQSPSCSEIDGKLLLLA